MMEAVETGTSQAMWVTGTQEKGSRKLERCKGAEGPEISKRQDKESSKGKATLQALRETRGRKKESRKGSRKLESLRAQRDKMRRQNRDPRKEQI